MNKDVYDISNYLRIQEKKKELLEAKERIFKIGRLKSEIRFHLNTNFNNYMDKEQERIDFLSTLRTLKEEEYDLLGIEYDYLVSNLNDYFKTINIDFRKELSNLDLPLIYVEQSHFDFDKHIIDESPLKCENENSSILITPVYDMNSIRNYRHFYNKISFKYLELLSEDYDFSLENKNLGKVLIR